LHDLIGNTHDLGVVGLQHDHVSYRDNLLVACPKGAGFLRFVAQALNGVHELLWLVEKSLAQFHSPVQVRIHLGD
jgi:hypothetical protein